MFCPKCGSSISDDAEFCPGCGENLEKAKYLLKESPGISDISESDSIIELSLEGDVESLIVPLNTRKKFYLKVKNNSNNPLYDVEVILSGPSHVELLLHSRIFPIIRAMGTNSIPFIILPKISGIFTLTVNLYSNIGRTITLPIELRTVAPASIENRKIQEARYSQQTSTPIQRPSGGINQAVAVLIIFALIGLILMISGVATLFRGGLTPTTGISLIITGFILLSIGTKGKCLILPCYCACDDCDCN